MDRAHRGLRAAAAALAGLLACPPASVTPAEPAAAAPASDLVRRHLLAGVDDAAARRNAAWQAIDHVADVAPRQAALVRSFREAIGGFPDRVPLDPQVTGRLERPGLSVERVVFTSQPGVFVTAALFLPDPRRHAGPWPAVLVACGHADAGKAHEPYQRSAALLATHGIAALLFDPIGQGERRQFVTPKGTSACGGCVGEHNATGSLLVPLGRNLASWMIWDAVRGLDYLASRPDIRGDRLGCMGNSGGGTQTAYVMALDDRVAAAAVSCYLTSLLGRMPRTIGPQDAEQNIFGQLAFGMDHADYLFMRAPRPTLVCAATRDFFDIGDTREAVSETRRIYDLFGAGERLALAETDAEHGFSRPLREAACRFMLRWLAARDQPVAEPADLPVLSPGDFTCTPAGSVFALPAARTFADLAAEESRSLAAARRARGALPAHALGERARARSGMRPAPAAAPRRVTVVEERTTAVGRRARLAIETDAGIVLPADLWTPASGSGGPQDVIYVDGKGRTAAEEAIRALVADGRRVLAVDLRGMGETAPAPQRYFDITRHGVDGQDSFLAYLLGRSLVGMRADDLVACAGWLAAGGTTGVGDAGGRRPVEVVAVGLAVIPALHAAAVHPELFAATRLVGPPRSWSSHVEQGPLAADPLPLSSLVHGALADYDLPDLIELVGAEVRR